MSQFETRTSRRDFLRSSAVAVAAPSVLATVARAAERAAAPQDAKPLQVAMITGGHKYDEPNFAKLLDSLQGMKAGVQLMRDFSAAPEKVRDSFDVVVFYTMLMKDPEGTDKVALEHLGATEQGIVVLHHAILGYPKWPVWTEITGLPDRSFKFREDLELHVDVANPNHPITQGLKPWDMIDETYKMADARPGSEILLTIDHPTSMKTIGWTRQYKKSRVFCFQSGHDNKTWANPNFREVLSRGIRWCARKI